MQFYIIIIWGVTKKKGISVKNILLKNEKGKAIVIAYFFLMGIIFHAIPFTLPLMMIVTPYVLLVVGGIVLYHLVREKSRRVLIWCAGTYLLTFFIEVLGVQTGFIFGSYRYSSVLGPKLFEAPLIIGFNWLLVLVGLNILARKVTASPFLAAGIVGAGAVVFDFVLEPVAMTLEYWIWEEAAVPVRNYIAWFCIAYCVSIVYHVLKLEVKSRLPIYYVGIQIGFFAIVRFLV